MKKTAVIICTLTLLIIGLFITSPSSVSAVMLQVDGTGQLTGATDVNVLGNLYDVSFQDGNCVGVFNGCDSASDFTFITMADANAASQALLDDVLVDGVDGNFDSFPDLTFGISDPIRGRIFTPWEVSSGSVLFQSANNFDTSGVDVLQNVGASNTSFGGGGNVFAVWSLHDYTIPEPSTVVLLASGLLGLGVFRKKFKK